MISSNGTFRKKIAVIGSGISGSVAANILSNKGFQVSIFEAGRGAGGRASSRRHDEYTFDHGAQYISEPKTKEFNRIFSDWKEKGLVEKWDGNFFEFSHTKDNNLMYSKSTKTSNRYVGIPAMNRICKYLLETEKIEKNFGQRVSVSPKKMSDSVTWDVLSEQNDLLGSFDWIVTADRMMSTKVLDGDLTNFPIDLQKQLRSELIDPIKENIQSVPVLILMVVLETKLSYEDCPFDGLTLQQPEGNSVIGWIARDSSKPERSRADGKECWVIQSTSKFATDIIGEVKESADNLSFSEMKNKVNKIAHDRLLEAFIELIPKLTKSKSLDSANMRNSVVFSQGHRWSAAFPATTKTDYLQSAHFIDKFSYVNPGLSLAACGDFFNPAFAGRVEGAALSGKIAAEHISDYISIM